MRPWELARFDGWVRALDRLGRRTRPATQMAPPPFDSIHAPASIARHDEREDLDGSALQGYEFGVALPEGTRQALEPGRGADGKARSHAF